MGTNRNTVARALHDVGAAAWFGGSLMGAIGVNGAAADVRDPIESTKVAQAGWGRWTPVNLAAIGAHLVGGALLTWDNKGRLTAQKGVLAATIAKTAVTGAAMGVTAYSRVLGEEVMRAGDVPTVGGTTPGEATPQKVADAQRRLRLLQWAVPALSGTIIVLGAYMGEQQRASQATQGVLGRGVTQLGRSLAAGALLGQAAGRALGKQKKAELKLGVVAKAPRAIAKTEAAKWATKAGTSTARTVSKVGRG